MKRGQVIMTSSVIRLVRVLFILEGADCGSLERWELKC